MEWLTGFLAGAADGFVVAVEDNTDLVHEPDLLLVVALELIVRGWDAVGGGEVGVDVGEEADYVVGCDGLGLGGGGCSCTHGVGGGV